MRIRRDEFKLER